LPGQGGVSRWSEGDSRYAKLIRLPDEVREWFGRMLLLWSQGEQKISRANTEDAQRQLTSLRSQKDRLLELYLLGEISDVLHSASNSGNHVFEL
jgi:hypothetical protein